MIDFIKNEKTYVNTHMSHYLKNNKRRFKQNVFIKNYNSLKNNIKKRSIKIINLYASLYYAFFFLFKTTVTIITITKTHAAAIPATGNNSGAS